MNAKDIIEKMVLLGKNECLKWKSSDIPFNGMLYALFTTTGRGDKFAKRCFERLETIAGSKRNIPSYLRRLSDIKLEDLASKIKFNRKRFLNGVKSILALDEIYNLQRDDLTHIKNPEEFYTAIRKTHGFGGAEIGPWVGCDFVRLWKLRLPKNLELPKSTKEVCLKKLEKELKVSLLPKVKLEDYPYIDAFFEIRARNGERLRNLAKNDPKTFIEEVKRLLNDP